MALGNEGLKVFNHDVAGLQRRINRFIYEMIKSVSNAGSLMNEFDQTRLATYLVAIRAYIGWVVSQPQLDLPETSPREYVLDPNPTYDMVENESIVDVVRMLELTRDEVVNSQSARNSSGLNKFDTARMLAVVDKVEAFLKNYIQTITPLDLPESSPMRAQSGPGRTGV
jgi:site-specific recombinase XerC